MEEEFQWERLLPSYRQIFVNFEDKGDLQTFKEIEFLKSYILVQRWLGYLNLSEKVWPFKVENCFLFTPYIHSTWSFCVCWTHFIELTITNFL